jgi:hypothetical protein
MLFFQPASGSFNALAQDTDSLTLKATEGFDGYCKEGKWLPIHVEIENAGADRDVTVRVSYTNTNQGKTSTDLDVALPASSRKKFFVYISPQGYLQSR